MNVLSDDFAAVDFREELCYHSLTEKANARGIQERQKPIKRKQCAAEKAAAGPQAVQRGRLRSAAPFGLVFRVVLVAVSRRVLGCGARQRGALVYDKHTPRCQIKF